MSKSSSVLSFQVATEFKVRKKVDLNVNEIPMETALGLGVLSLTSSCSRLLYWNDQEKYSILSVVSSLYDPLGILASIIITVILML